MKILEGPLSGDQDSKKFVPFTDNLWMAGIDLKAS